MLSKFSFFHRFLNLMSFSSDLVLSTRVNCVVFWRHLGAKFQNLPGTSPLDPIRTLPWTRWGAYSTPQPQLHKAMTFGTIKHNSNSLLISQRPQYSFCANLQLAKCVWAIHQTQTLFQVSPV